MLLRRRDFAILISSANTLDMGPYPCCSGCTHFWYRRKLHVAACTARKMSHNVLNLRNAFCGSLVRKSIRGVAKWHRSDHGICTCWSRLGVQQRYRTYGVHSSKEEHPPIKALATWVRHAREWILEIMSQSSSVPKSFVLCGNMGQIVSDSVRGQKAW